MFPVCHQHRQTKTLVILADVIFVYRRRGINDFRLVAAALVSQYSIRRWMRHSGIIRYSWEYHTEKMMCIPDDETEFDTCI